MRQGKTHRPKIVCVDFDGVVHSYAAPFRGATIIPDPPVPGAFAWLAAASARFEVCIYSSRSKEPGGIAAQPVADLERVHLVIDIGQRPVGRTDRRHDVGRRSHDRHERAGEDGVDAFESEWRRIGEFVGRGQRVQQEPCAVALLDGETEHAAHEMARRVGELAQDHLRAVHVVGIGRHERLGGDDAGRDEHADVALGEAVLVLRRQGRRAYRAVQRLGADPRAHDDGARTDLPVRIAERGAKRLDDAGSRLVILPSEPADDLAAHARVALVLERNGASEPASAFARVAREAVDCSPCGRLGLEVVLVHAG